MNEMFPDALRNAWPLVAAVFVLVIVGLVIRHRRSRVCTFASVLANIAFDRIQGIVIPKADEGEIEIEHLVLTAEGLLIIEVKDVVGTVFGSDKMQDWTVISDTNRFTFTNPQPALYDRIAAVRQIVRQVPVSGRIVFLDGASFTKGVPSLVCTLEELDEEFGDQDQAAGKVKIEAFKPHWERIKPPARRSGDTGA